MNAAPRGVALVVRVHLFFLRNVVAVDRGPDGGTGRRRGLKIPHSQGFPGSTPGLGIRAPPLRWISVGRCDNGMALARVVSGVRIRGVRAVVAEGGVTPMGCSSMAEHSTVNRAVVGSTPTAPVSFQARTTPGLPSEVGRHALRRSSLARPDVRRLASPVVRQLVSVHDRVPPTFPLAPNVSHAFRDPAQPRLARRGGFTAFVDRHAADCFTVPYSGD